MVLRAGYSTPFQTPTRSSSPLHCAVRTLQQLINDFRYSGTSLHSAGHHFDTTSFYSTKFETSINYLRIDSSTTTKLRVNSPGRVFDFTEILDFKSQYSIFIKSCWLWFSDHSPPELILHHKYSSSWHLCQASSAALTQASSVFRIHLLQFWLKTISTSTASHGRNLLHC